MAKINDLDDAYNYLDDLKDNLTKYNIDFKERLEELVSFVDDLPGILGAIDKGRDEINELTKKRDELQKQIDEMEDK